MKKILTLALVLVMVLGLAAPALAYSSNTAPATGSSLFTLDINIVRYTDAGDFLSGWITAPYANEGYAVGQVVAVVGALNVPGNADFYAEGYRQVYFSSTNVNLNVVDNYKGLQYALRHTLPSNANSVVPGIVTNVATGYTANPDQWSNNWFDGDKTLGVGGTAMIEKLYHWAGPVASAPQVSYIPTSGSAKTYRWLCFGKVTGDNATMSFGISGGKDWNLDPATPWIKGNAIPGSIQGAYDIDAIEYAGRAGDWLNILDEDYSVIHVEGVTGRHIYLVFENINGVAMTSAAANANPNPNTHKLVASFETKSNNVGDGMILYDIKGSDWRVEVAGGELVFYNTAQSAYLDKVANAATYKALTAEYNSLIEDTLGFSAFSKANTLKKGDFKKLANDIDAKVTVDIEPWTPYVQVPENIVVDPPKTGETASVLGFVMIVMAAAAAFVAKKVRA